MDITAPGHHNLQELKNVSALAWLPHLDGWRGLSVIAVLVGHFAPISAINTGRLGVEMFFCLSGRLMAQLLFVEKRPIPEFLLRRVSRVWPALYIFVFAMIFIFAKNAELRLGAIDVLGSLTFTENYIGIFYHRAPVVDHLWSLAIEEWAYLFLAAVAFTSRKFHFSPMHVLLIVTVTCIGNGILQTIIGGDYYSVYWRTDVRMASITLACIMYLFFHERRIAGYWPIMAITLGFLLNINRVPDPIKYTIGTSLIAFGIATIDQAPPFVLKLMSLPWLRWIGLVSFSLYLWQQPFAKIPDSGPLFIPAVFACAILSFYLIEKPTRRYLNAKISSLKM